MKNASEFDVNCVVKGWYGDFSNLMFGVAHPWHGWLLAHIKQHVEINRKYILAMETADGCPIIVEYEWLRAIPKREGTPAKPKHVHTKGSKPWLSKFEYVDYDPKLIVPGVRVKCRDKKIRTVDHIRYDTIEFTESYMFKEYVSGVDIETGLANYISKTPWPSDIMKILVEKKIDKPVHDRYNGYAPNVWYFWQGASETSPVDGDVKVEYWLRGWMQQCRDIQHAKCLGWKHVGKSHDIIAFKIITD